ncbi:hypothetical protein FA15DRAFT_676235 [Coprinopsis marcescibilis]|uniref:Uncharacterized protein n=1 Tax=Coprinopsis marcescibilis TaxID=230819 RepID=A0A5C3KB63_COPMA|nr:hypothetical protein FA15DRAFT_676235 [Coprinopsis marcescibilis]
MPPNASTHILFALRGIPYKNRDVKMDPTHRDYPAVTKQTQNDRDRLLQMLDFIKSQQGPTLRPERFKFTWKVQEFPQGTFPGKLRPEALPDMLYGAYKISNDTMNEIARATPGLQSFHFTEAFYNCSVWRAKLPAHKRKDVPRAWSCQQQPPPEGQDFDLNAPRDVCFLVKGVDYRSESQTKDPSDPHYSYLHTETSEDMDTLDRFLRLIKNEGGPSLERQDFKYGYALGPNLTTMQSQEKIFMTCKMRPGIRCV